MLRRLINTFIEVPLQSNAELLSVPFTKPELVKFGWLVQEAPCFPVSSKNVSFITMPSQFYNELLEGCKTSTKRITLASLYLGNGKLESRLVEAMRRNESFQKGALKINVLLDYHRGSRLKINSRIMLKPLLEENSNCTVSLYHTPAIRGIFRKIIPQRFNELAGLQHMKLYIFDDTLVISGANLSNDYFTNRQDRYFVIKDKQLCDFYDGLIKKVQEFSLLMDKDNNISMRNAWNVLPYEGSRKKFTKTACALINDYIEETKQEQNNRKSEGFDTWIFPLVQMGQLGVLQDERATTRFFSDSSKGARLKISTGYFNLTSQYINTILNSSEADVDILMAHPKANGFLGAEGIAGGIPYAYSLIAKRFKNACLKTGQLSRINLFEYIKEDWTFHGKGLWYYSPGSQYPFLTLIGSSNFGERSVRKDLETQVAIITENEELRKNLHSECEHLFKSGIPADTERKVSKWIYVMVFLFKHYF